MDLVSLYVDQVNERDHISRRRRGAHRRAWPLSAQ
jgi:hypothetical protein